MKYKIIILLIFLITKTNNGILDNGDSQSETTQSEIIDILVDVVVEKTSTQPPTNDIKTPIIVDVVVPKNKLDMQSFEEWKEMKLKITKNDLQKETGEPTTIASPLKINRQRKNYASLDCGAKVLASNPESNNPSHVLTESKDDYMLNSCSRRFWFVVELCEPIKITQIELANFELFSNVPRLFKVHTSERYIQLTNGKDWPTKYFYGLFEAANQRTIQTFSLEDAKKDLSIDLTAEEVSSSNPAIMYAKYIKFEMLSHYGTEHYCPLSLVRIYGTSMAEDEEEVISDELEPIITESQQVNEPIIDQLSCKTTNLTISLLINNVISNLIGENFNLKNLFQLNKKSIEKPLIQIQNIDSNSTSNRQKKRASLIQTDFLKLICFNMNQMDCCECNETNVHFDNRNNTYNWLTNKCAYFYLISSVVNNNKSLIVNYLNANQDESLNKTSILLNGGIEFLISDEWLDTQLPIKRKQMQLNETSATNLNVDLLQFDSNETNLTEIVDSTETNETSSELTEQQIDLEQSVPLVEVSQDPEPTTTSTTTPMSETTTVVSSTTNQVVDNETVKINVTVSKVAQNQTPPPPPIIIGNGKEAVYMRLSNRIKILELNMSLSSQYLEKLSQHYRTQMDEMELAFNKTTTALIDTTRIANERDHKQHEKIQCLEKRLDKIQKNLDSFNSSLKDLKLQADLLTWFVLIAVNIAIIIQLVKCLIQTRHKSSQVGTNTTSTNKQHQKTDYCDDDYSTNSTNSETDDNDSEDEPLINQTTNNINQTVPSLTIEQIDLLIENKLKLILEQQQQITNYKQEDAIYLQQQNAAAAAATLAVVAATLNYSIAATCSTLNQKNEDIESFDK